MVGEVYDRRAGRVLLMIGGQEVFIFSLNPPLQTRPTVFWGDVIGLFPIGGDCWQYIYAEYLIGGHRE